MPVPILFSGIASVAGDGNCFWRAAGVVLHQRWSVLKKSVLRSQSQHSVMTSALQEHLRKLQARGAWADNVAAVALASHVGKTVCIQHHDTLHVLRRLGAQQEAAPIVMSLERDHFTPVRFRIEE